MIPAHARATVSDYLSMAEGGPRFELIEGELRMAPAPNTKHQRILGRLHLLLGKFLEEHPLGEIYLAPCDVFLSDINVFQPDLLYVAKERQSLISERGIEGAPDIVVEILSPSSRVQDLGGKKRVYTAVGVREYWVIDPETEELAVYALPADSEIPARTLRKGDLLKTPFLPDFAIPLEELFRRKGSS